jgi:hypothetical protein
MKHLLLNKLEKNVMRENWLKNPPNVKTLINLSCGPDGSAPIVLIIG